MAVTKNSNLPMNASTLVSHALNHLSTKPLATGAMKLVAGCLFLFMAPLCLPVFGQEVLTARSVWEEYRQNPDTHPLLPNCSYAGYHYSERPLPQISDEIRQKAIDVKSMGAIGDGRTDDTQAILQAIERAPNPGYVFFPAGDYKISDMLRIQRSNLVLFGDGADHTRIIFEKSLSDILGPFMNYRNQNRWSFHGGLIWIAPRDSWNRDNSYKYQLPGDDGLDLGWLKKEKVAGVFAEAPRGCDQLRIMHAQQAEVAGLKGKMVVMVWHEDDTFSLSRHIAGHPAFESYPWEQVTKLKRDWEWIVEIEEVLDENDGAHALKLKQPLRVDIQNRWKVALYRIVEPEGKIEEVGIQGMTLKMRNREDFVHHLDKGYNGIYMQRAVNCWVNDVNIIEADNSVTLESTKCVTIANTSLQGEGRRHHGYYFRYNVHDCLVTDFHIGRTGNEALSISHRSSGNVFRRGHMERGSFDSHCGLPFDHIRTCIVLDHNDGHQGGNHSAGPRNGARVVHWNLRVTEGRNDIVYQPKQHAMAVLAGIQGVEINQREGHEMPRGDKEVLVVDHNKVPDPADIFLHQLRLRTGTAAEPH